MKLAAIINVGHGPAALKRAVDIQMLLLDRLGTKLDSIRLAGPRLLRQACMSAIAEKPDVLVMAGGPRSSRRAGEIACTYSVPIVFLPDVGTGGWTRHLRGSLSLEDMVLAVAREDFRPIRIDIGMAGKQMFFGQAGCGLFPHLPELHGALEEADTFGEGWHVLTRAAQLAHFLVNPNVHFNCSDSSLRRAAILIITLAEPVAQIDGDCEGARASLRCSAIHYGPLGLLGGLVRSSIGNGWRGCRTEHFNSAKIRVEAGRPSWILLDGDPVRFEGDVEFRFAPAALQTFAFNAAPPGINDNHPNAATKPSSFHVVQASAWNFPVSSHVASLDSRQNGCSRPYKKV
jgi:hypothetical protein